MRSPAGFTGKLRSLGNFRARGKESARHARFSFFTNGIYSLTSAYQKVVRGPAMAYDARCPEEAADAEGHGGGQRTDGHLAQPHPDRGPAVQRAESRRPD